MTAAAPDLARDHWRRQLVLSAAFVAVGTAALRLVALSVSREEDVRRVVLVDGRTVRSASHAATLWPAAVGIVALLGLAIVLLVHVFRVAAFTFRRGDN